MSNKREQQHLRSKLYDLLENPNYHSPFKTKLNVFFIGLICLNVIAVLFESVDSIGKPYAVFFSVFETFSVLVFTFEYLARIWCISESQTKDYKNLSAKKKRLRFFFSAYSIIDLLVILPYYLSLFFNLDLRILRTLRILRILKFTRYFSSLSILTKVLKSELMPISAALSIMLLMVLVASSFIYLVEKDVQPEVFSSIPAAMWWSIVTLSTVGYGDVVPMTLIGKLIGTVMMILGVGMVALPAGMLASRFSEELHRRQGAFRSKVEEGIQQNLHAGKLLPLPQASLERLRETLNLSEEEAQEIIQECMTDQQVQTHYCPYCGKRLKH